MYKSCVLLGQKASKTVGINSLFSPTIFSLMKCLGITAVFTQLYKLLTRELTHIKLLLTRAVISTLSTVSTCLTIKTTILKFNELIIKEVGST